MKEIKTYREAEAYLLSVPKFTSKNSPAQTAAFFARLGKPGETCKIIHVAGTNGKGSVCAYLHAILTEAGFQTAMFTSPHLVSMRERFRIGNKLITEEEFLEVFLFVMAEVREEYHPTFFECLFFMAMVWFAGRQPDYLILETGLGGRLDATNVIAKPKLTVITKIALDHTEYLGETIAKVAWEKAGIIKPKVPLVFWDEGESASVVIRKRAEALQSAIFGVSCRNYNILRVANKNIDFSVKSKYDIDINLTVSSPALYQVQNVALAVCAAETAERSITREQIVKAVANVKWEGRMEEIMPDVFVDGAHNVDGIQAFLQSVRSLGETDNHLLFAVVKDKDYESMIKEVVESHLFSSITVTKIAGDRAVSLSCMEAVFKKYTKDRITLFENAQDALRDCLLHKGEKNRLYIAGSLYLVGLMKGRIGND